MSHVVRGSLTQMSHFSLDWEEPVPSEAHLPYYTTGSSTTSGISGAPVTPQATLQRVGSVREKQSLRAVTNIDPEIKPGEYVLRSLFTEFTVQAERKIEVVLAEPLERPLSKSLQRGEDPQFDQLLSSLNAVAEHCLPSLLRTLFEWYDRQNGPMGEAVEGGMEEPRPRTNTKSGKGYGASREKEKDYLYERRDLAVDFIFCLVLIEVLKQSHIHPIPDSQVKTIENLAFKHFRHREGQQSSVNASNLHIIADLYAEVIGVLTQSEFHSVRRRFMSELKELRSKEQNMHTTQGVIALIMGMKFFRVKLFPVEDLEASFQFMQECGKYFLEVKDKDIKHALAGLFVEILVPVAAAVKNDVMLNLPAIKCFVEMLYQHTLEMSGKKKHALALFPLVTCLLCVSQKQFFLNNWHYFLSNCLSHLKNRDPKMSRVALESLYRLLWVYMIRIKCESNTQTQSRLQNIVNSLFPKGSRNVVPRDTPLNIFVKIIQFIAQERLDFAMREIVFDLLCVGRPSKLALYPERMNIGLRAFLVIADSLEQKDGEPPMPSTVGVLPSGNTLRVKKTFLNKMLTDDTAKQIGIQQYYPAVRKSLDGILRALDLQVGRSMSMTNVQCMNKEPEDMITGERKPKIDLFRTCVAAIPRLIPEGMSKAELIDMLSRLTVHMDEELRNLAFTALQNLVLDFPAWREDVLNGFIAFVLKEVHDTHPLILDSSLRMLVQFLTHWRTADQALYDTRMYGPPDLAPHMPFDRSPHSRVLHRVEGFALVILCSCRPVTRKLGVIILKEVRTLLGTTGRSSAEDETCIDVMDRICPAVVETCLPFLAAAEKAAVLSTPTIDLQWLADRQAWIGGVHDTVGEPHPKVVVPPPWSAYVYDPWSLCLAGFLWYKNLPLHCPAAVSFAWPDSYCRLTTLFSHIDPNNPANQGGSLRGTKKMPCATDEYIGLWRNYLVFACRIAPPSCGLVARPVSPDILSASPDSLSSERADNKFVPPSPSGSHLFKLLVPLIRSESVDVQGAVVAGLGRTNAHVFRELIEEMHSLIKEALERKQENMRRRRRRDCLRVQLGRILELVADSGVFSDSCAGTLDKDSNMLVPLFVEYMDGMRMFLESEGDKDSPTLQDIRLHFSGFVHKMIRSIPVDQRRPLLTQELRYSLFFLLANWCGRFGVTFGAVDSTLSGRTEANKDLKLSSLQKLPDDLPLTATWAPPGRFCSLDESLEDFGKTSFKAMSAVLCSGPVFDSTALSQDGYLYNWLDSILDCQDDRVHQLGRETVVLLLTLNPEVPTVLNWAVDRCYTGSRLVAAGCFHALAAILCERDYPCDMVSVLNVTLFKTGDPCNEIRDMALQLLQVLDNRFFGEPDNPEDLSGSTVTLTGSHLPATFTKSQMFLSQELSRQHPEFTIPMFSEISHRLHRAHPEGRQVMMEYLLPWLQNLELVDEFFSPASTVSSQDRRGDRVLRGEGWGSVQATNMILNNLLYITAKYGDEHPRAVEQFWATMVQHWPNNLHVILEYLINMAGITTQPDLLPYVKRAVIYLCRAKPDQMVEELMNELQSVEIVNAVAERIAEPPYYRLSCSRKTSSASTGSAGTESPGELPHGELGVERDTPSRRFSSHSMHKTEEATGVSRSDSVSSHRSTASQGSISSCMSAASHEAMMRQQPAAEADRGKEQGNPVGNLYAQWKSLFDGGGGPLPLPMPENGGYYCPLSEYLRETATVPVGLSRCNLGVVLLAELVLDRVQVEWTVHLPLMLHTLFLGLDHSRTMVHEHCKKLLLNLLIVLSSHNDYLCVARTLLTNRILSQIHCLSVLPPLAKDYNFIADPNVGDSALPTPASDSGMSSSSPSSSVISGRSATPPPPADSNMVDVNTLSEVDESAKALIEFITTRSCRPLWCYEDLTSRQFTIRSAEQMCTFLRHVVRIFSESLPGSHLQERWGQIALHMALSCSSRHYAGRSFQMFRALQVSVTSNLLCDILARLVETVADPGEDMQGYVTEILLTLESLLDKIAPEACPPDYGAHDRLRASSESISSLHSTPNLHRTSMCSIPGRPNSAAYTHHRSASMSKVKLHLASPIEKTDHHSNRMLVETRTQSYNTLPRSRSTQSMKSAADKFDTRHNLLSQLFWVCVSLLESDYDHEFLLALKLMDRLLNELPLDRSDCVDEVNRVRNKLKWSNFPGMQMLLFKGFTSPLTTELTLQMVAKLTVFSTLPVVDPSEAAGFPLNVLALMPYLINHYDSPDKFCTECAENIAEVCLEKSKKLHNLAHIMSLYSNHTFGKPCKSWVSAVCKYLHDAYSDISLTLLTFLVEILEKGMLGTQQAVLQLLYSLLHQVDLGTAPIHQMNADLLRIIAKYVQSNHWQESLNILKLAVQRSSTLVSPEDIPELKDIKESSLSLTDIDVCPVKRDLPGPTLEFRFDVSQTPIIGRRGQSPQAQPDVVEITIEDGADDNDEDTKATHDSGDSSSQRQSSSNTSTLSSASTAVGHGSCMIPVCWKKPHLSQRRTRERLVNVLSNCGQNVGLPKSPSVIFSSSSDLALDRQTSMYSSSDEVSPPDLLPSDNKMEEGTSGESGQHFIFKDFDFLDAELEEAESEGLDNFNWGVRRRSLDSVENGDGSLQGCQLSGSVPSLASADMKDESSDDESISPSEEALPATIDNLPSASAEHKPHHPTNTADTADGTDDQLPSEPISMEVHKDQSSALSISSVCSEGDGADTSPGTSPHFSSLTSEFLPISMDEIEEVWLTHVGLILSDSNGTCAVNTFQLFARLYRITRRRFYNLTRECCNYLGDKLRGIASQFLNMLELLVSQAECPHIFTDTETILSCKLLERHKFAVLEIQEHYDTYICKRDATVECLDKIKESLKRQSLGEEAGGNGEQQQIELCRHLYKLHFQLLLLFQSYSKLVKLLSTAANAPQVTDFSRDASDLKARLQQAIYDVDTGSTSSMGQVDTVSLSRQVAEESLLENLKNGQLTTCVQLIRAFRSMWPNLVFGSGDEDDMEYLLALFCKHVADNKTGVLVMTRADTDLSGVCHRLMEVNIQLLSSLKLLEIPPKSPQSSPSSPSPTTNL